MDRDPDGGGLEGGNILVPGGWGQRPGSWAWAAGSGNSEAKVSRLSGKGRPVIGGSGSQLAVGVSEFQEFRFERSKSWYLGLESPGFRR